MSVYSTAAVPPSAETEWDRIACTFVTTAMLTLPLDTRAASIAARNPAMPEPTMTRSYDSVSVKSSLLLSSNELPFAALHEYKGEYDR